MQGHENKRLAEELRVCIWEEAATNCGGNQGQRRRAAPAKSGGGLGGGGGEGTPQGQRPVWSYPDAIMCGSPGPPANSPLHDKRPRQIFSPRPSQASLTAEEGRQ